MDIWPNFFIVGAPRSGSTSLYEYLRKTKGVYMPFNKEPHYYHNNSFASDNTQLNPSTIIREREKYLQLFKNVKDEKAIGEGSTTYFWYPDSSKLIHDQIPDAKIIILLRDPVERAFSHFLLTSRFSETSFHDVISKELKNRSGSFLGTHYCTDPGLYSIHVKRFFDIFGKTQVKILIFEEFVKDVKPAFKEILKFLNVDSELPDIIGETYNEYSVPRGNLSRWLLNSETFLFLRNVSLKVISPNIRWMLRRNLILKTAPKPILSEDDRASLEKFYYDDVKKLEVLIGRKFPWKWLDKYQ